MVVSGLGWCESQAAALAVAVGSGADTVAVDVRRVRSRSSYTALWVQRQGGKVSIAAGRATACRREERREVSL